MTLYIGYPISYETACDLYRMPRETNNIESIVGQSGLSLYATDKGQCILGLKVDSVAHLGGPFVSVDDGLIHILEQKKKVVELIQKSHIDLSDFMIQPMEDEEIRVHNPPPYLITANSY